MHGNAEHAYTDAWAYEFTRLLIYQCINLLIYTVGNLHGFSDLLIPGCIRESANP